MAAERPDPSDAPDESAPAADSGLWTARWASRRPDDLAWADDTRRCSWRDAEARVARLAGWLCAQQVGPGDRVALWLTNRSAVLEALFACARVGAIVLPLNARLTPSEIAFQLGDAGPRVLLIEAGWRALAETALAASPAPPPACLEVGGAAGSDAYEAALAAACPFDGDAAQRPAFDPEAPLILMYTSGTTGRPKGALLPHRKTLSNCENARACFGIRPSDRVLVVTPLFHSLGLQILALPALCAGAGVVIQEGFEPGRVWRAIEQERICYFGAVPTVHQRLVDALDSGASTAPRGLRFAFTAGAAAPAELLRAYQRHGLVLIQGYGQTETSLLTCQDPTNALAKAGSVGRALPHAVLRWIDPATIEGPTRSWRDVPPGAVGEIVVGGPIRMLGYWQRPEDSRATLRGEWLRTGDLATRDDEGDVQLVGRAREMYISGGENVYPAEVEAVLTSHPDVAEAAVVAIPDARWGEVGRAHLVLHTGRALTPSALSDWLAPRLARYKQPRAFVFEASLPRTASGKVQKHRLTAADADEPGR